MNVSNLSREEMAHFILTLAKDSVIEKINILLHQEEIIGYTPKGEALTVKKRDQKLAKSEADYNAGRITTHQDLKEEIKNW